MPGIQHYTKLTIGKETTPGTAVAGSRLLYPDDTGFFSIDPMLTFGEDANRGTKTHVTYAISQGIAAGITFRTPSSRGVAFDELVIPFSQIRGGQTGAGGTAAKVWNFTPVQTSTSAQESYTFEPGDDNMSWRMEYGQASRFRLSGAVDQPTMLEMDIFARQASITSTISNPTPTNPVLIPGKTWTIKFANTQGSLDSAATETNFLLDWDLDVTTGLVPRRYQDGNAYFGQSVEGEMLDFTLTLHGESTSQASTRYSKWINFQVDFVRLSAAGPSLGSSTYKAEMDLAVLWQTVQPIASQDGGVNIWEFVGRAVYDSVWNNSIVGRVTGSIASLPGI